MKTLLTKFLLVVIAWAQRKLLSIGRMTWQDAIFAVEQVDASSAQQDRKAIENKDAAYKPMTSEHALKLAQGILCESIEQRTGQDLEPNVVTRRIIQAAHVWVRLKAF